MAEFSADAESVADSDLEAEAESVADAEAESEAVADAEFVAESESVADADPDSEFVSGGRVGSAWEDGWEPELDEHPQARHMTTANAGAKEGML